MSLIIDTSSNFHPYECDGPGDCIHCDRDRTRTHDPDFCVLCYDDGREPTDVNIYGAGAA